MTVDDGSQRNYRHLRPGRAALAVENPAVSESAATAKSGFTSIPTRSGNHRKEVDTSGK